LIGGVGHHVTSATTVNAAGIQPQPAFPAGILVPGAPSRLMRIGLHALGIGAGARRPVVDALARAAEEHGFSTLWAGEHVVMVDSPLSRYPYNDQGEIPVPADADWLDPLICLSFAAAATHTITLATGVLLLPEHNPVLIAKQAASLDVMSGGRFTLGVGIGWSRDEFVALGVPYSRRANRTVEYVRAIKQLWSEDVATFHGQFVDFDAIRVYPKPVRDRRVPVVFGGNSDPALARAAAHGDGWYGFNLSGIGDVRRCVAAIREHCARLDRDFDRLDLSVSVVDFGTDELDELADVGVNELVLVDAPPPRAGDVGEWVRELAQRWLVGTASQSEPGCGGEA